MSSSRKITVQILFFILFAALLVFSCSEDSDNTDGDGDSEASQGDGDSEQSDGDLDTADPCARFDCSPGYCKPYYDSGYCVCPEGFRADEINVKCVEELPDEDRLIDGDEDDEEGGENCLPVGSGPFADLKPCSCAPVPCVSSMPFEYTGVNPGEFKVAFDSLPGAYMYGPEIWEEKFVFFNLFAVYPSLSEYSGVYIVDYPSKNIVHLADDKTGPDTMKYMDICESAVYYTASKGWLIEGEVDYHSIYRFNLNEQSQSPIVTSQTTKKKVQCQDNKVFWHDKRKEPQSDKYDLYTLQDSEEKQLNQLPGSNITAFRVHENRIAYNDSYYRQVLLDLDTGTEKVLDTASAGFFSGVSLWGNLIAWNDYSLSQSTGFCGSSIAFYDIEKEEKTFFKTTEGFNDYIVLDIWQDWLIYMTCQDGTHTNMEECCRIDSKGNIFLHYLPSGEEWQITNSKGGRANAKMYDHLIVWMDCRANPDEWGDKQDLYGIDLCMHPELKTRFESCEGE